MSAEMLVVPFISSYVRLLSLAIMIPLTALD
jgi:hypothetical protein